MRSLKNLLVFQSVLMQHVAVKGHCSVTPGLPDDWPTNQAVVHRRVRRFAIIDHEVFVPQSNDMANYRHWL